MYICVVEDADFESHDVATRQKKKACINNVMFPIFTFP